MHTTSKTTVWFSSYLAITTIIITGWCFPFGTPQAEWLKDQRAIMGTSISVELWHDDVDKGKGIIELVFNEMNRIDHLMSTYREDSQLSYINKHAHQQPVKINSELYRLINRAQHFSKITDGAFDITYASAGHQYNYRKRLKPSSDSIAAVLPAINYKHLILDDKEKTIHFEHKDVIIDLGGIAKGHAVDRCIKLLRQQKIKHAIVTAGGDSRLLGDRRGQPWTIGIRNPRTSKDVIAMLPLTDAAISTSGDYERYFVQEGTLYHHIINPKTGDSARSVQSVTIIGEDATTTDALSTSIFVLGPEKGLAIIETLPTIEAVIIDHKGRTLFSSGLAKAKPLPAQPSSQLH